MLLALPSAGGLETVTAAATLLSTAISAIGETFEPITPAELMLPDDSTEVQAYLQRANEKVRLLLSSSKQQATCQSCNQTLRSSGPCLVTPESDR